VHGQTDLRESMIGCLYRVSGPEVDERVEVAMDTTLRDIVVDRVKTRQIHCCTFAQRQGFATSSLALFVLTETHFYELSIAWKYWVLPEGELADTTEMSELQDAGEMGGHEGALGARLRREEGQEPAAMGMAMGEGEEEDELGDEEADFDLMLEQGLGGLHTEELGRKKAMQRTVYSSFLGEYESGGGSILRGHTMQRGTRAEQPAAAAYDSGAPASGGGAFDSDKVQQRRVEAMQKTQGVGGKAVKDKRQAAKFNLVAVNTEQSIKALKQVAFGPTEDPSMKLTFGSTEVKVLFFDDTAREKWRRQLASVLNRSESAPSWNRDWVSENI